MLGRAGGVEGQAGGAGEAREQRGSAPPPSLMDAHMDIQACLSILEALSVSVPSARSARWTFEMLSTAILKRLSAELGFSSGDEHASSSSSKSNNDMERATALNPTSGASSKEMGIGAAGARAESAMRHSFQSQGFPSPLPKLDQQLPTELSLLDNLFLNPMIPHPKASDSTAVGSEGFPPQALANVSQGGEHAGNGASGGSSNPGEGSIPRNRGDSNGPHYPSYPAVDTIREEEGGNGGTGTITPRSYFTGSPAASGVLHPQMAALLQGATSLDGPGGVGDLQSSGFDFLSFLAADDGGQGANAVWEQTEAFRQEMPMLG